MITINYTGGGFGNHLFQYVFARLLAEKNNLNLNTDFTYTPVLQTTPSKKFDQNFIKDNTVFIDDNSYFKHRQIHGSCVPQLKQNTNYIVSGYFQDADLYNTYFDTVKTFFILPEYTINTTDTLVTIRLGDFIHSGHNSEIIHYDWYNQIIPTMPGKKILLTCCNRPRLLPSTEKQEDNYISNITSSNKNITYIKTETDLKNDFKMRLQYENTICSNSTFSWWGAFLGSAKNIITFSKFGRFGPNIYKSHGPHINNLANIKNISTTIDGEFLDITQL